MTKEEHRVLGITFFNKTWDYIDKNDKTKAEEMMMLDYAHASKLHWELSDPPVLNIQRAEWLIARVYSELNQFESANLHAKRCAELTRQHNIDDFDLVFAYEALARAHLIHRDRNQVDKYLDLAYEALKDVKKEDDKEYCKSQLDAIQKQL